jgi:2-desacetyl-2-hydroxyethyl bacteriochlorophyllide A dehydrogenase
MIKSRSLWYTRERSLEVREVSFPQPGPHEVLVKVDACGVCTWDLFIYSGGFQKERPFPFYFGHEGVGHVVQVGEGVTRVARGDRVALRESPVIGAVGTGHMAEYALQPESVLVPLPEDRIAAKHWMIEPVACCINAVDLARIPAGARVALVGSGFMGGILLELLAMTPASTVAVFDLRKESLEFARTWAQRTAAGGASIEVHDLASSAPGAATDRAALNGTFDVVIETAAVEPALNLANNLVRSGGTLVIFSWHHHPITFDFGSWHTRGITVLNASPAAAPDFSRCFTQAVPLIASGRVDLAPLVTHVAPPEDAAGLYEDGLTKENGYIKGVITWN